MKIFIICLLLSAPAFGSIGYYQSLDEDTVRVDIINELILQCEIDLDGYYSEAAIALEENRIEDFNYWSWKYEKTKEICTKQLECINNTGDYCS